MAKIRLRRLVTLLVSAVIIIVFISCYLMLNKIDYDINLNKNLQNDVKADILHSFSIGKLKFTPSFHSRSKFICKIKDNINSSITTIKTSKLYNDLLFDNIDGGVWKQGFDIKYSENSFSDLKKLKVFVVPHSHNDPGWLKTFEQYYKDQTFNIFSNMVDKLEQFSKMRFIYAESSFLNLWWSEIDESLKIRVKRLLKEKRLEFVTGGWVMNDEAAAHYWSMLDQMIEGTQWMVSNTGFTPTTGWSIDPFGYSSTMAYLLNRMNFTNMLIQRVHYTIKKHFSINKQLEFNWIQQWDNGISTAILCHMMPFYSYDVPHTCGPDPKICCQFDFKRLEGGRFNCPWKIAPVPITDSNVEERAKLLLDQYRKKSQLYTHGIVLIPLGDDFRYDTPTEWINQYTNYQKLFDYMNNKNEWHVEAKFATLSEYFEEIRSLTGNGEALPSLSGDFYTYADRDDNYWSGYFTSRIFYKKLDRESEALLRSAEIIYSLAQIYLKESDKIKYGRFLEISRRNLALFQHHDGITGTAKEHVVIDYGNKLMKTIDNSKMIIRTLSSLLLLENKDLLEIFDDDELRLSHDDIPKPKVISVTDKKIVYFFNSLSIVRTKLINIYVDDPNVSVRLNDDNINFIEHQIHPVFELTEQTSQIKKLPWEISNSIYKISFLGEIPPLGFKSFVIEKCTGIKCASTISKIQYFNSQKELNSFKTNFPSIFETEYLKSNTDISLKDRNHNWIFSSETGLLKSVSVNGVKGNIKNIDIKLGFSKYGTREQKEKSGAYLFLPDGYAKNLLMDGEQLPFVVISGPFSSQICTLIKPYINNCVTVTHIEKFNGPITGLYSSIEIENLVDIRSQSNTELTMDILTNIYHDSSERVFYTDLNGFQMQRRQSYDKLTLQGNIYPMTTMTYLENTNTRFTVLSAQASGVGSLEKGALQIFLDRRLNQDDFRGLEQGVLDNKLTPNKFIFILEIRDESDGKPYSEDLLGRPSLLSQLESQNLLYPINQLPLIPSLPSNIHIISSYSALNADLPLNIHLVNLRSDLMKNKPTSALIIHRLTYNCRWPMADFGSISYGKIELGFVFSHLRIESLTNVNLRLLPNNVQIQKYRNSTIININEHDIQANLLTFQK